MAEPHLARPPAPRRQLRQDLGGDEGAVLGREEIEDGGLGPVKAVGRADHAPGALVGEDRLAREVGHADEVGGLLDERAVAARLLLRPAALVDVDDRADVAEETLPLPPAVRHRPEAARLPAKP